MNIVEPYAKIIDILDREEGIAILRDIELFGRVSHRSEDAQSSDSWQRFIESVVNNHCDYSIIEHRSVSVEFYTDRGVGEEQVRHRLFSYTKESTRFVSYLKKLGFSVVYPRPNDRNRHLAWVRAMETCESSYFELLKDGWSPQEARSVIPLAFATKTIATGNLRNWRHLFLMRTTKETHPQMRQVIIPLLEEFKSKLPLLYDDIEPLATQRENLKKPR